MTSYNFHAIEAKQQKKWQDQKLFETKIDTQKPKYYILDMFPYPSGAGLHVGHPEGYTASDILARVKRMQGYSVLHPMGWDAFGLPAENYAIKTGVHPKISTEKNIATFKKQIQKLGFSYDWTREINTTSPEYYKWTQWIFLKLYKKGLAYEQEMNLNWCPTCKTVVANEEVENGLHERCEQPVEKRNMRQWMLKITEYADSLLQDIDDLSWPEAIKEMQRNWIGKSEGAEIKFQTESGEILKVYTTRPDTLFGCTYMVLSPEHPFVEKCTHSSQKEAVQSYQKEALMKSERERKQDEKEKTGVFLGTYAYHPITQEKIPLWIADYVLSSYGTGAIMAVPSCDLRDKLFAEKFSLPIKEIFTEDETLIHSDFLNGKTEKEAKEEMIAYLSQKNLGERKINYKLRDWVFSRQRYWGEPIPLLHTHDGKIVPLSPSELPLLLPETDSYQPSDDGQSPLANIPSFINREFYYDENGDARFVSLNNPAPEGKEVFQGKLETLTMPNWAGSSWYYLRYMDPYNENEFVSKEAEQYFQSVDMYIGGAEHAVLHLLYARFWHKVLFDLGLVSQKEPFLGLKNVGMILSFGYKNEFGKYYHISEVEEKNGEFFAKEDGKKLERNIEKMSKSKYNVVNPDDVVNQYGADTLRLYEMFMGPFDQTVVWDEKGIVGVYRFLEKLWSLLSLVCEESPEEAELRLLHQAIQKISSDTDNFKFNTAISHAMITVNEFLKRKKITKESLLEFITLLSPYIPHITDEMAEILGHTDSLAFRPYPHHDEKYCTASLLRLAIQVNGKVRGEIEVSLEDSEESIIKKAQEVESVKKYLVSGYSQVRYVRGRIVSFVV